MLQEEAALHPCHIFEMRASLIRTAFLAQNMLCKLGVGKVAPLQTTLETNKQKKSVFPVTSFFGKSSLPWELVIVQEWRENCLVALTQLEWREKCETPAMPKKVRSYLPTLSRSRIFDGLCLSFPSACTIFKTYIRNPSRLMWSQPGVEGFWNEWASWTQNWQGSRFHLQFWDTLDFNSLLTFLRTEVSLSVLTCWNGWNQMKS